MNHLIPIPIVAAALLACGAAAADLGDYAFVLPKGEVSKTDAFVVEDVNGLLARALGGKLPVVTAEKAPKTKRIYVRKIPDGFDFSQLAGADAAIRVRNGDIWLFGRGANAVRFAAYDYLVVELGYRFFDARGGVKVPDLSGYEPKDADRIVRFDFPNRSVSCRQRSGREAALFHFRTGLNKNMEGLFDLMGFEKGIAVDDYVAFHPFCHGLAYYFPKNRRSEQSSGWVKAFADCDYDTAHPEYFTQRKDGKHDTGHQPCLSNPEVRGILKRNYFNGLARRSRPGYNDLSAGDTPGRFCWCTACRALEKKYGTPGGPLVDLHLALAGEAAKRWPDQKMLMLAYRKEQTEKPPTGLAKLPDNFVPDFAPIDDDFSKDWSHPNNADTLANLREWCRLCREVMVWYYPNPYGGSLVTPPLGNVGRLATDMRLMKEAGATTALFEHNVGVEPMTGFSELQSYVIARLFRDASLDWRALAREFLAFEYGAAAPDVQAYLDELEELRCVMPSSRAAFPWDANHRSAYTYLTAGRLAKWEHAFDAMEWKLRDDGVRLRTLRRLRLCLDYSKAEIERDVSVLPRIRAILNEIREDAYSEKFRGLAKAAIAKAEVQFRLWELTYGPNARGLPQEIFGKVPRDNLTICMAHSDAGGAVDDGDAAYGTAARLLGSRQPKAMHLPFVANVETYLPRSTYAAKIGEGVTTANLGPKDAYRFYFMGDTTLTQDLHVEFNTWWMRSRGIGEAYKEGAFNRARIYASLKFQGPAFYAGDTRENAVFCDRVVVVRDWDGKIACP